MAMALDDNSNQTESYLNIYVCSRKIIFSNVF